jgi:serine/threonine-protein kinase
MAEVFLARARDSEQLAVIKRLRAQLAVEPEFVRMFLAEGRLALTLRHPNVVEVFDVGESGDDIGQFYIAMEYLHGHDLRETVSRLIERRGTVRLDQALSVARAVAAGLHYTHEHAGADGQKLGIVHRDVSPHNVLLTFDGRVKLVDFGIAKTNSPQAHTRTGVLKGKAAYMAPEQAMGLHLDRRSDVFCLGILMWEMTTGMRLFRRRTELDTLNAVAHAQPPRPSRVVARYPRDLESLVMKTLAHEPEDRWATAADLIDAIDELARRRKVELGTEPVRALACGAFAEELAAWRAVQAFGISLGDHLVARNDREATRPNDTDLETESDQEQLPVPAFEMTRHERPVRPRRWWWVAVVVLAVVAGAGWLGVRHDTRVQVTPPAIAAPVAPRVEPAALPATAGVGSAVPPPPAPPPEPPAIPAPSGPPTVAAGASAAPPPRAPTPRPTARQRPPTSAAAEHKAIAPATVLPPPPPPAEPTPVKPAASRPSSADLDKLP